MPNRLSDWYDSLKRKKACDVCQTLLKATEHVRTFDNTETLDHSKLSTWGESESIKWTITAEQLFNGCSNHGRFLHPYVWLPDDKTLTEVTLYFARGRLQFYITYLQEGDERPWSTSGAELLLINKDGSKPGMALGRPLDREFIDTDLLNQWKTTCAKHHGDTCFKRITSLSTPPAHLIDTMQMCLVPATQEMTYVALSYVWGRIPMLKTTRGNLKSLQQPGVLQNLNRDIPTTIRDSITLVPLLEERYLWVDALCIVQDDEDLQLHIDQMAAIFEAAVFTIVVPDGDNANFGLRGLRHSSQPRRLPEMLRLAPDTSITARLEKRLHGSPWSWRGWTLQEQIFSRRKIVFFGDTAQWMCRASTYYEDVDSPHDLPPDALTVDGGERREKFNPLDLSLDVPDLSILCHLLSDYTRRKLSYQEDVIPALSSTFRSMWRAFPRGFLHGLPVSFFDATLIWRSGHSNMARRKASAEGAKCPPSWTWAGWRGHLESHSWTAACYMKNQPQGWGMAHWEPFQVIPMLTWYTKESRDSEERRLPFQNEWYHYKARFMGKDQDLPRGWAFRAGEEKPPVRSAFKDDPECQVTYEALQTSYYYEHSSCPGRRFWHPVPIGGHGTREAHEPVPRAEYLCAETQQARLWAAKPRWDDTIDRAVSYEGPDDFVLRMFGLDLGVVAVLRDGKRAEIGELSPDSAEDLNSIWGANPSAISIDVVAVSRGLHFPDPQLPEKETWSFYNVLWVEWKDGVAYRKGVGRVKRSAWDGLEREDISLVMG